MARLETKTVILKGSGREIVINAGDFDPSLHQSKRRRLSDVIPDAGDTSAAAAATQEEARTAAKQGDNGERDALLRMTVKQLKELPEYDNLEGKGALTNKPALVDAILAYRKADA